jgi:hypothetical protein
MNHIQTVEAPRERTRNPRRMPCSITFEPTTRAATKGDIARKLDPFTPRFPWRLARKKKNGRENVTAMEGAVCNLINSFCRSQR